MYVKEKRKPLQNIAVKVLQKVPKYAIIYM